MSPDPLINPDPLMDSDPLINSDPLMSLDPSTPVRPAVRTASRLAQFGRAFLRDVIVTPVRSGRLRDGGGWPYGLSAVVAVAVALYVGAVVLVLTSSHWRSEGVLGVPSTLSASIPRALVWVLILLLVFSLALFESAALRGPWWLKTLGAIMTALVMGVWGLRGSTIAGAPWAPFPVGMLIIGVVVFVVVRARKPYAWWEFPVLFTAIGASVGIGLGVLGAGATSLGFDFAPVLLQQTMTLLVFLVLPAALSAGAAVAEIAVSATLVATRQAQRLARGRVPYVVFAVVLLARLAQSGWQVRGLDPVSQGPAAFAYSALVVLALVLVAVGLRGLAPAGVREPVVVSQLPEVLGRIGLPVGAALVALLLPLLVGLLAFQVVITLAPSRFAGVTYADPAVFFALASDVSRVLTAVVLGVLAVRLARRGQGTTALLLGYVAVVLLALKARFLTGYRFALTTDVDLLNLLGTAVVVVVIVVLLVRRRLGGDRAIGLSAVLILSALFSSRDFVSDPLGALVGFSGGALVLFGLTWDFLTGSEWGNGHSRRFPRPTRTLLVLANTLLAITLLAFVALTRDPSSSINLDLFAELGDLVLGTAVIAAAYLGVLSAVARDREVS